MFSDRYHKPLILFKPQNCTKEALHVACECFARENCASNNTQLSDIISRDHLISQDINMELVNYTAMLSLRTKHNEFSLIKIEVQLICQHPFFNNSIQRMLFSGSIFVCEKDMKLYIISIVIAVCVTVGAKR